MARPIIFTRSPAEYFVGIVAHRRAVEILNLYSTYTGWHFDRFAALSQADPVTITLSDIVGVSMLSVDIPPEATVWLLGDGASRVHELLEEVSPEWRIWDDGANVGPDSAAWALWSLIRTRDGQGLCGMGPTRLSKLLAIKRPNLIPIRDSYVSRALFDLPSEIDFDDWGAWQNYLRSPEGTDLQAIVRDIRTEADYPETTSLLRIMDIVIWHVERFPELA